MVAGFFRASWLLARRHAPLVLPYVALFFMVRSWFGPGLIAGDDFATAGWNDEAMLRHYVPWPDAWDPSFNLGVATDYYLFLYPVLYVAGILTHLGLGWNGVERILWLYPLFILLPVGAYALAYYVTRSSWASAAGALAFSINTWTVGLIERGHIPQLIGYALIPLGMYFAARALEHHHRRDAAFAALVILAQGCSDIRFGYLTAVAIFALWVVNVVAAPRKHFSRRSAGLAALFLGIVFVGSLYWLIPGVTIAHTLPQGYTSLVEFNPDNADLDILHSFSLFYPFYHYVVSQNPFVSEPVEWPFVLFGFVGALGLLVGARGRPVVQGVAVAWLIGTIFGSGSNSFFGALNKFLFIYIPGMGAFRDARKIYAFTAVGLAVGSALLIVMLPRLRRWRTVDRSVAAAGLSLVFVACYLFAMHDAYNPVRFSNFSAVHFDAAEEALQNFIPAHMKPGRILYYPIIPTWLRFTEQHPAVAADELAAGNSPFGLAPLAPPGLTNILDYYGSPLALPLLCELGIRYAVVVTDPTRHYYRPWHGAWQRGEALAFFNTRAWARRIPISAHGVPMNRMPAIYEITGCSSDPNRLAFVAKYPVLFQGDNTYIQAFNGSPFWQRDPVVVIASEQKSLRPFHDMQNIVGAPRLINPDFEVDYAYPYYQEQALLGAGDRLTQARRWAFHGFAFHRIAEAETWGLPLMPGLITGSFHSSADKADIMAVVAPQYITGAPVYEAYSVKRVASGDFIPAAPGWCGLRRSTRTQSGGANAAFPAGRMV